MRLRRPGTHLRATRLMKLAALLDPAGAVPQARAHVDPEAFHPHPGRGGAAQARGIAKVGKPAAGERTSQLAATRRHHCPL